MDISAETSDAAAVENSVMLTEPAVAERTVGRCGVEQLTAEESRAVGTVVSGARRDPPAGGRLRYDINEEETTADVSLDASVRSGFISQ